MVTTTYDLANQKDGKSHKDDNWKNYHYSSQIKTYDLG